MPSVEMILSADVLPGETVAISVPQLRQGDINPNTAVLTIGGFAQSDVTYLVDLTFQNVDVGNSGTNPWSAGAKLTLTWDGVMIEPAVIDLQNRMDSLETSPPALLLDGGTMEGPLYMAADPVEPLETSTKQYTDDAMTTAQQYADAAVEASSTGVTDGADAAPGEIAEYLSIDNMVGLVPPINTAAQICSISLPPGCWEVWGACDFTIAGVGGDTQAAAVQPNQLASSVSLYPDMLPTQDDLIVGTGVMNLIYSPLAAGQRQVLITGQCRSNSSDPITLYLVAAVGSANANVKGYLSARRVR